MDSMQVSIMTDAIELATQLRKPENADLLAAWLSFMPEHDILRDMFYSKEHRADWRKQFGEEMPDNFITVEQNARLVAIEHAIDEKSGHSGFSWDYMVAAAKVIAGGGNRNGMYMNWINQAEEIKVGSTAPLSAGDIAANKRVFMSDDGAYLYNDKTKTYDRIGAV